MEKFIARHACYRKTQTDHQSMLLSSSKRVTYLEGFPFVPGFGINILSVKKLSAEATGQECFFEPELSFWMQTII